MNPEYRGGRWGGTYPLPYELVLRRLVDNTVEASTGRTRSLGSSDLLSQDAAASEGRGRNYGHRNVRPSELACTRRRSLDGGGEAAGHAHGAEDEDDAFCYVRPSVRKVRFWFCFLASLNGLSTKSRRKYTDRGGRSQDPSTLVATHSNESH